VTKRIAQIKVRFGPMSAFIEPAASSHSRLERTRSRDRRR